jgi:hypothetical protein
LLFAAPSYFGQGLQLEGKAKSLKRVESKHPADVSFEVELNLELKNTLNHPIVLFRDDYDVFINELYGQRADA